MRNRTVCGRQAVETLKLAYFQLAYLQQTLPVLERDAVSSIQAESSGRTGGGTADNSLKEIASAHQTVWKQSSGRRKISKSFEPLAVASACWSPAAVAIPDWILTHGDTLQDWQSLLEVGQLKSTQASTSRLPGAAHRPICAFIESASRRQLQIADGAYLDTGRSCDAPIPHQAKSLLEYPAKGRGLPTLNC